MASVLDASIVNSIGCCDSRWRDVEYRLSSVVFTVVWYRRRMQRLLNLKNGQWHVRFRSRISLVAHGRADDRSGRSEKTNRGSMLWLLWPRIYVQALWIAGRGFLLLLFQKLEQNGMNLAELSILII